jgi:hypothetical protein
MKEPRESLEAAAEDDGERTHSVSYSDLCSAVESCISVHYTHTRDNIIYSYTFQIFLLAQSKRVYWFLTRCLKSM